ncbi:Methylthioadenosine phosphorylase [Russula brevipes]|nr:Methylthioadenosine phosphorylase [Russula brevipes]
MTTNTDGDVLIGVIGGSGLYHLDNLTFVKHVNPETPWGFPSSPITIAFSSLGPSTVPARANIAALKSLGVRAILAFSAVGSLREDVPPGTFALPTQIIDRTKGVRPASFFEGTSIVAHAAFGDPFSRRLGRGVKLVTNKCIVCMEGPQFSTRAESHMYRQWGGDLINMSVLPEAKLAREAEIRYGFQNPPGERGTSRHVAGTILQELHAAVLQGDILSEEAGSMQSSILPRSTQQRQEDRDKLCYVLPAYFSD